MSGTKNRLILDGSSTHKSAGPANTVCELVHEEDEAVPLLKAISGFHSQVKDVHHSSKRMEGSEP